MNELSEAEINQLLQQPSNEKPLARQKIEEMAQGQGVLPKVLLGAAAVPAMVTQLKMRESTPIQVKI